MICSDGLTDMVSQEKICRILHLGFEDIVPTLLEEALAAGGRDNISVILCRVQRELWYKKRKERVYGS